ncbi:MAG: SseB family protein [Anaerolineae bacterium]|nr:SseB family protein [Anaerolineae bacterium]
MPQTLPEDDLTIEQVIHDIAEHGKDEDFHLLYEKLAGRELYIPVVQETLPTAPSGEPYVVSSADQIRMHTTLGPDGKALAPAATSIDSPMLRGSYISMDAYDWLEMALKIDMVHGVAIQGRTSWVGFDKEEIKNILDNYKP